MSTHELEVKIRELHQLQSLIEEAEAEAEPIKDQLKAHLGDSDELRTGESRITYKAVKSARLDAARHPHFCRPGGYAPH